MSERRVHADLIIHWANGGAIEYFNESSGKWYELDDPSWDDSSQYRKAKPEWQQKLIDAVKAGKIVEYRDSADDEWVLACINKDPYRKNIDNYGFVDNESNYRIAKDQPIVRWQWIRKEFCYISNKHYYLTTLTFLTEDEAKREYPDADIQKAEWTRTEFLE